MKFSILIAAIILGLATLFGVQQKEKIKLLTSEWEDLKTTALEKNISTDPKAAFSLRRASSDSARAARQKAIEDFASELVAFAQKMKAAEEAGNMNEADWHEEIIAFMDKLTNMNSSDLKSLVEALAEDNSIEDETKEELIMMSIMMISSTNPETALTLISESSKSLDLKENSEHLLRMVISQYAAQDPLAAAAWITENQDELGEDSDDLKTMIIQTAAAKDFKTALSLVSTLELSENRNAYGFLASGVTTGSKDDFLKAIKDNSLTKDQRNAALASLVQSPLIKNDFETAKEWLNGPDLDSDDRKFIIQNLQYYAARENPSGWLSWLGEQEEISEPTEIATRQIISGWTRENFVATGEWIQSQDAGPAKNTAVTIYAETLAPHEPAAAADWAVTLPESPERTQLLQTIHTSLKKADSKAAAALVEKYQLTID